MLKQILTLAPLSNYRTYLAGAALVILAGLHTTGYIGDSTYAVAKDAVLGGGLMALRAALGKTIAQ